METKDKCRPGGPLGLNADLTVFFFKETGVHYLHQSIQAPLTGSSCFFIVG